MLSSHRLVGATVCSASLWLCAKSLLRCALAMRPDFCQPEDASEGVGQVDLARFVSAKGHDRHVVDPFQAGDTRHLAGPFVVTQQPGFVRDVVSADVGTAELRNGLATMPDLAVNNTNISSGRSRWIQNTILTTDAAEAAEGFTAALSTSTAALSKSAQDPAPTARCVLSWPTRNPSAASATSVVRKTGTYVPCSSADNTMPS